MTREARQGARLLASVSTANLAALVLFGVGIATGALWLCVLAVVAVWTIMAVFYVVLNRLGDLDD